jgi:hypothetical protein
MIFRTEKEQEMNFEIAFVGMTRETHYAGQKPSATYTFAISDGPMKCRAEVVLQWNTTSHSRHKRHKSND